ncbi:MAG: hypothetical protein IT548_19500 [Alphaproteobacteria bacterium]|nr:hypothetical protein [Alphaproteobacteria bacterium]
MIRHLTTLLLTAAVLTAAIGVAQAFDRRIRIKNETGQAIVSIQAGSSESGWSGEVLGSLPAGKAAMATIDDGSGACTYDFTAKLADGGVRQARGVNVCDLSVYAIK